MNKPLSVFLFQSFLLLAGSYAFCQEKITLTLLDKSDKAPLEFVNVINLTSRQFYYSDANGKAEFVAKPTDSLLISQMGYLEIREQIKNLDRTIFLEPNIKVLDEVILVDRSKNFQLNEEARSRHNYSLNTAQICAFKLRVPQKSSINKIVLPVAMKRKYDPKGILRFQLYRKFENGRLQDPLTPVFVFDDLEEIEEEIVMEFPEVEVGTEFYLSATRDFNNTRRVSMGAFNPFLQFGRSSESDDIMYRHILSSRWFNLSWDLSNNAKYKLVFYAYGRPLKN
ncbi:hypothetical protein BST97_13050 [Nonlabens spongiae]|uniref:Carboxypeptidase-like regulatory domain-containing protein n=1 Tax=Nonlabens spongiae TaxID=331648 RepID=A0A1W6MML8_9FLAO|nr:hypothetical protein [Nonlabens spongiae]ARN78843.1 hypothetical protein BST97_13050 [Nonlabens spongiae]